MENVYTTVEIQTELTTTGHTTCIFDHSIIEGLEHKRCKLPLGALGAQTFNIFITPLVLQGVSSNPSLCETEHDVEGLEHKLQNI